MSVYVLVMQSSPLPCYLIPLGPKYPPQHFILVALLFHLNYLQSLLDSVLNLLRFFIVT
jgi:hypothetical protein